VRYVGEPIWASRTRTELREATKHEALINLAFAGAEAEIQCPYDSTAPAPAVLADARRPRPPLPGPRDDAMSYTYRTDLSQVRALVLKHATDAGLPDARANDLVLAVSEVAANTLRHTRSSGTLTIWHDPDEIICEIHDEGVITDPLAGRRAPPPDALGGHGLWLVHQVCDLVELRSDNTGTTIRMHMSVSSPRQRN
jgi:anti-sigma regulatory factor (Ser/Thr protein kinase)